MKPRKIVIPAILEPDLDLLGLDVGENGALSDQLLPAQRAGLGALSIDSLERLHLLSRVPHILASVKVVIVPADAPTAALSVMLSHSHRHFCVSPTPQSRKSSLRATCFVGILAFGS
jgi:hypothetical protein